MNITKYTLAKCKNENVYRLARYMKIKIDKESYSYAAMKWLYSQIEHKLLTFYFDDKKNEK